MSRNLKEVLNYGKDFETGIKVVNLSEFLSEATRCFERDQLFHTERDLCEN